MALTTFYYGEGGGPLARLGRSEHDFRWVAMSMVTLSTSPLIIPPTIKIFVVNWKFEERGVGFDNGRENICIIL